MTLVDVVISHTYAMSALQKKLQGAKALPPKPPMLHAHSKYQAKKKDFTVIPWKNYFDCEKEVNIPGTSDVFHYYQKGELIGPIVVLLHGGGFSGLSWALFSRCLSGLVECCCVAIDQRGHGSTKTADDTNLTADQLAKDIGDVMNAILKDAPSNPVILIGHSMGGAIAVHAAAKQKLKNLVGLVVIDVVEGSALDSLHAMRGVLANRPRSFESIEKANEWCTRTGYVRNLESTRVSMIGQLIKQSKIDENTPEKNEQNTVGSHQMNPILEDEESADSSENSTGCFSARSSIRSQSDNLNKDRFVWRIDLTKTSQYWEGWFKGMSSMFLSVSSPKLLLLAGVDRLDAQMTTAQMQGKFQMQIVARSGHAVHEDAPDKVAKAVASFLVRHKFVNPIGEFQKPMPVC